MPYLLCAEKLTWLREGKLFVMALDWAKAFDSLSPESMIAALRRFGLSQHGLGVTRAEAVQSQGPEAKTQAFRRAVRFRHSCLSG